MSKIYGQLERAALETLSSNPAGPITGRIWWNTTLTKAFIDDGTNIRALLRNDGFAVLGNNGTANNNIRFHRGANSVLQLVLGGDTTAEGTLSTNLAQVSARAENYATGSLPTAGLFGRVAYDTTVNLLKFDNGTAWYATSALLEKYATGSLPAAGVAGRIAYDTTVNLVKFDNGTIWNSINSSTSLAVTSKVANYTLTTADDVVLGDSSGGTFTLTLPTAVGNAGKTFYIKKTDSSFTAITIDGDGTETIDGSTTTTVNTQNEEITIVSDNANWQILSRRIPSFWYAITLTPNAAGFGTVSDESYFAKRVGDSLHVRGCFTSGTPAASPATISLPSEYVLDTSKIMGTQKALVGKFFVLSVSGTFGAATVFDNNSGVANGPVYFDALEPDRIRISSGSQSSIIYNGNGNTFVGSSGDGVVFDFIMPIVGWKG